jgi:hypothetical protein
MKTAPLVLLIISLCIIGLPVQAQDNDDIRIEIRITPRPNHDQLDYGETYVFDVKVVNLDLDLDEDEPVDPDRPLFKFSGDLVVYVSYEVGRQGSYELGGELVNFNHTLERWDESHNIGLPRVDRSKTITFTHKMSTGYDGEADMDEWVTFSLDVYVYIEEYWEVSGEKKYHLGDPVDEAHLKLYVISDEKKSFVADALKILYDEITGAKFAVSIIEEELGVDLEVDISGFDDAYLAMKAYFDDGDYISAMAEYSGVERTWKDDVIVSLQQQVEDKQETIDLQEAQIEGLASQFSDLTEELQELQAEHEDKAAEDAETIAQLEEQLEAEKGQLNAEIVSLQSTNRLYLFAVIAVTIVFALIVVRYIIKRSA